MTFYVAFKDGSEIVVCAPDKDDAIEMSTDLQRNNGGSTEITDIQKVADK